jgi:hypothetical protein
MLTSSSVRTGFVPSPVLATIAPPTMKPTLVTPMTVPQA